MDGARMEVSESIMILKTFQDGRSARSMHIMGRGLGFSAS